MSNQANRAFLSAALIGVFAFSAPLAASAQTSHRANDRAPAHQNRPQVSPAQTRPSSPAPSHQVSKGPQRPHVEAQRVGRYRLVSTVNLRSGPGQQYRRAGQVRAGRMVQVDAVRNGWLHIRNQGWISAQYARRA